MFIFLDTETTGNKADDRLCQIAFKAGKGKIVTDLFKDVRVRNVRGHKGTDIRGQVNYA